MKLLETIKNKPHVLGHWLGYNDLSEIHSKWIIDCWDSGKDYTLQAHRNSYKTTAVLVIGAIRWLFFHPNDTILISRKSQTDANKILSEIATHYNSDKLKTIYKDCYNTEDLIKRSNSTVLDLTLHRQASKESNIETIGMGGGITGGHFDKVMGDDLITVKDRVSKAEREATKTFIRELKNIPKTEGGTITITGTPWHKEDAYSIIKPPEKYPLGSIHIKGFTDEKIEDIKQSTTPSLFAANYELKHISSDDHMFADIKYCKWDMDKSPNGYIDPAYSGTNTSSMALLYQDGEKIVVRGWAWRQDITELYSKLRNLLVDYNSGTVWIESNADKGLSLKDFRNIYPASSGVYESMNKHLKIVSYLKQNWNNVYFAEDCQPEFIEQIVDYVEGDEPDDAPDALAALIRQVVKGTMKPSNVSASRLGL